jgi:hypothetical protein
VKLSKVVARVHGDPELAVEGENGVPRPVVDFDFGVMLSEDGQHGTYILLEPASNA